MKKFGCFLMFFVSVICLAAQDYAPKILPATTEADVLLCFESIDIGVTSVVTNVMPGEVKGQDLVIKSLNKKQFKITGVESYTLNEALDAEGKVLAYMVVQYTIKKDGLKKANKLLKNNQVLFSKLIDGLSESDFINDTKGSTKAPDPKTFTKLRNAFVYNIYLETTEGNKVTLQVVIENFTDASEL